METLPPGLIEEIEMWLQTRPSRPDMLQYAESLERQEPGFQELVANELIDRGYYAKKHYFKNNGAGQFIEQLDEFDQYYYLRLSTEYNEASILKRLGEEHPPLQSLSFPADFHTWATGYIQKWDWILVFLTLDTVEELKLYAKSILSLATSKEQLQLWSKGLVAILERDSERSEIGDPITPSEQDADLVLLKQFSFLPESVIRSLQEPGRILDKKRLLMDFITVLAVLDQFELEQIRQDPFLLEALLEETEIQKAEYFVIELYEKWRILGLPADPDPANNSLSKWFFSIWTLDNIASGVALNETRNYLQGLNNEQKNKFFDLFKTFLSLSVECQTLVEPDDPYFLATRLQHQVNFSDAMRELNQECYQEDAEPLRAERARFFQQLWNVFHVS